MSRSPAVNTVPTLRRPRLASVNVGSFFVDTMGLSTKEIGAVMLRLMAGTGGLATGRKISLSDAAAACLESAGQWWKVKHFSSASNSARRYQRISAARVAGGHTGSEWLALLDCCSGRCLRCGATDGPASGQRITKDHIVPISAGGDDRISNIQPLCRSCNSAKGLSRTDFRGRIVRARFGAPSL